MRSSSQFRAAAAIQDVENGRSLRQSSIYHQVPRNYITRRIQGLPTREDANEAHQKLSKDQETYLANWIITQGTLGYAPPHSRFRLFAQRLLIYNGGIQHFGKNWHTGFLTRNPSVKTIKGKIIDYKRLNGATAESLTALFDNLALDDIRDIPAKHRYNADEFGLMEGVGDNSMVFGKLYRKYILLKDLLKRQWITILAYISADARALPPLVIFCGKNVQQ